MQAKGEEEAGVDVGVVVEDGPWPSDILQLAECILSSVCSAVSESVWGMRKLERNRMAEEARGPMGKGWKNMGKRDMEVAAQTYVELLLGKIPIRNYPFGLSLLRCHWTFRGLVCC